MLAGLKTGHHEDNSGGGDRDGGEFAAKSTWFSWYFSFESGRRGGVG